MKGVTVSVLSIAAIAVSAQIATAKPVDSELSSWRSGSVKDAIVKFVEAVTDEKSPDFVKPSERIAVFDNDGTLWCEMPIYPQVVFVTQSAKQYAQKHPEIRTNDLFRAALEDDKEKLRAAGARGTQEMVNISYKGMSTTDFAAVVDKWITTEQHPRFKQPYTSCVYQPMLEVIAYFKKNGFQNYIVSGGGTDFMRPWTERTYDIPPEHVIGSTCKLQFALKGNEPLIERVAEIDFICDRGRKPVAIERTIGRRPLAAFGNSNGDIEMLQWTSAGSGKRLAMLVHHTDAEREYEYGKDSKVGRLDKALDLASQKGWTVIDMKKDWKKVFPFQND